MISFENKKLSFAAFTGAVIALFAITWAASAKTAAGGTHVTVAKHRSVTISAFHRPFKPNRAQRAQRRAIARMIKRSPRASIASSAKVKHSRAVKIEGYPDSVWIAPADDGSVCTFIPDPVDGWGAGCATPEELLSGNAVTMLGGAPGTVLAQDAIVAIVIPDGGEPPTVQRSDGSVSVMNVDLNVAAAVLPSGALVRSGRASVAIPDPQPSNLSP